jgi:hypothetical protein
VKVKLNHSTAVDAGGASEPQGRWNTLGEIIAVAYLPVFFIAFLWVFR